ncbi:MAG TPA: hypothetical protein VN455_04810 [Methanotrichaceae archaeon]|nr:hypothetical protein [Methanotrichaceae archaeon]
MPLTTHTPALAQTGCQEVLDLTEIQEVLVSSISLNLDKIELLLRDELALVHGIGGGLRQTCKAG